MIKINIILLIGFLILVFSIPTTIDAYAISEDAVLPPVINEENEAKSNTATISFKINQTNIESTTKQLTDYGERRPYNVNTSHAANYIKNIMLQTGLNTSFEEFYYEFIVKSNNVTGINVVGIKKSNITDDKIILVTAHYDSIVGPGADDNAAGVAAMLEAARAMQDESFNRTIYFIAFSGEEDGRYGSKAWISEHKDLSDKIVAVINLDYIGKKNLFINYIPQYGWLKDILNQSARDFDVPIGQDKRGWVRSDHATFWDNHIPAVEITHVQTDPYLHTQEDTIDKVDFSAVRDVAKIIVQTIYYLDRTGDNIPPSVNITIPENNSITCTFNLTYDISDRNSTIEVFLDNSSLGHIKSEQRFIFTKGNYTIKILATDDVGNVGEDSITFSCNKTYNPKIKSSSISAIPVDIISSPSKEGGSKLNISTFMTNIVRLEYNLSIIDASIFLDGICLGYIESGHLFVLDSGIHTFEVYNEKNDGTIDSDNVTFEVGYNPPLFDDLALNKQNKNNNVLIVVAFIFFAIVGFKMKKW